MVISWGTDISDIKTTIPLHSKKIIPGFSGTFKFYYAPSLNRYRKNRLLASVHFSFYNNKVASLAIKIHNRTLFDAITHSPPTLIEKYLSGFQLAPEHLEESNGAKLYISSRRQRSLVLMTNTRLSEL